MKLKKKKKTLKNRGKIGGRKEAVTGDYQFPREATFAKNGICRLKAAHHARRWNTRGIV